jgi:hypothetical protein
MRRAGRDMRVGAGGVPGAGEGHLAALHPDVKVRQQVRCTSGTRTPARSGSGSA